jgi:hypothetical protein
VLQESWAYAMTMNNTVAHLTIRLFYIRLIAVCLDRKDLVVFCHLTRSYALDYRKVLCCILPFLLRACRSGGGLRS